MTNIITKSVIPILIDADETYQKAIRLGTMTPKKLILISLDDDLKDGDSCLVDGGLGRIGIDTYSECVMYSVRPKKVIADQSQIPDDYIQKFISEYNIDDVKDVDIECWDNSDYNPSMFPDIRPKITDNFITFVQKK